LWNKLDDERIRSTNESSDGFDHTFRA
jgi:hypothetical protein